MPDTAAHLTLSPAQTAASRLRVHLERLGAAPDLARRVVPRADIEGRQYVYLPALPLDVIERLLDTLDGDVEATP